jgi:hypothetical protein
MGLGRSQQKIVMRCWSIEHLLGLSVHDYNQNRVSLSTLANDGYNCIAYAAGDDTIRWWPSKTRQWYYFWPPHLPREDHDQETLENFIRAFEWQGFSRRCNGPDLEKGIEKVAIFANSSGIPKHAARQLESGMWANKCGDFEDIECTTLKATERGPYGAAVKFLKRRRDGKPFLEDRIRAFLKSLGLPF